MKTGIFCVITFGLITVSFSVDAQQPGALTASPSQSVTEKAINLQVWTGRATAIDFSSVNEQITQIFLADPSRFTYATDTPLETGRATTIFLRRIKPLQFPNLTTASVTNLFVKTKIANGNMRLYTFNLQAGENLPKYSTIDIAAVSGVEQQRQTLEVGSFRRATLSDIERGLVAAVRLGYAPTRDPIVFKVREFLAIARNTSSQTLVEIAQKVNLPLPVLTEIGLLGIEDNIKNPAPKPSSYPMPTSE